MINMARYFKMVRYGLKTIPEARSEIDGLKDYFDVVSESITLDPESEHYIATICINDESAKWTSKQGETK
jgi:hypothetical protein